MVNEVLRTQPHYINGKKIDCKIAIPKEKLNENSKKNKKKIKENKNKNNSISTIQSSNKSSPLYFRKMFVGGLHPSLTTENLINYFSQFGEIEKGIIMTDKITGKSRGFGFIIFSNKETVDKIMDYSNCHFLYGKWVECKRAQPKMQNMKMLDENESFPILNIQNNNSISNNFINNSIKDDSFDIIINDSMDNQSNNLLNDNYKINQNLFLYQNYIPKEKIKLFTKNNDISNNIETKNNVDNNINFNCLDKTINDNIFNNYDIKKEKEDLLKIEKYENILKDKKENKKEITLNNTDSKNQFQDYFNNKILNPSSYNYFHYKLFDTNGEDVTKLNSYNKNINKIRLFPEEMDDSFEKNKKSNSNNSIKSNKTNTLSSEEIEVSSELNEKNDNNSNTENIFGPDRNKKEKSRSSGYSNDSYKPY